MEHGGRVSTFPPSQYWNCNLNARFGESDAHSDLFAHENVRVVRLGETALQLVQLRRCKPRPVPLLLHPAAYYCI